MANEVNIDRLSIEIQANAEPAAKGIGDLVSAVKKFNSAIAGSKGFGDLVTLANASKTASDNMQDAPNRLRELASALNEISQSMKGLKIPSDLSKGLSEIGASARSIGANVGQRLQSLAAGLSALRDVGNVHISSSIGSGINAINEALANLNVNNLSRIDRFVESVRQLESINNLTISASLAREITNIAEAAELVGEVDFAPLRDMGNAIAHLAVANDIRIGNHLAENIVNLGIAVQEVQGTDWTEFERMAEGLRHLEGLGQIRIPRMPGARAARQSGGNNGNSIPTGNASEQTDLDGIANATDDATEGAENLNDELTNTNQLLQNALGAAQNFARQFAGGFVQGAGLSGLVTQLQQVFSSPGNAIGYGLGAAIQFAVRQIGNLASAFKNLGIKAFTASINALRTALHGIGSAAAAAGKGLVSLGKMGARGLAGIAKIEFKGLMALPTLFGSALRDKIASITKGIGGFVRSLGRIAFYRAIRTAIKEVTKAFSEGVGNLYQWSLLVDRTFANSMDKIATSMQYLKNSLGAMVSPIINTLAPVIDFVVDKIVDGINLVNQFLAAITGNDTYTAAKKVATEWAESEAATDGAKKNLKEIKKTILGFDELNILNKDTDNGSSSSGSKKKTPDYRSMFETRPIESAISDFAKKIREAFESGEWTQLGAMFADKLNGWVDAIDWPGIGRKLGDGLNIIIDVYNGFMDTVDWFGLGDNLADGINSFMDSVDWYELGRALTQHIDALFTVLGGFVEKFDWFMAGESLADAVYGMFDGIDWDRVGMAIGGALTGVGDILYSFAYNFPWGDVGSQLASGTNKLFSSVNWVAVSDGLNGVFEGALDSLNTFIDKFSWKEHGETLKDGLVELVTGFPTSEIANSLTGVMWGILEAAMPTLNDTELMHMLGFKIADFFNGLFDPKKDFWSTAGEAANALLVDLLTIGDSFVSNFKEKTAADSIKKALGKIEWGTIASETWELIRKTFNKAGSFANALFSDESNSKWDPWEKMYVPDNSVSLGTRIANSLKKVIGGVPWTEIATDTWEKVKSGFKVAYDFVSAMFGLDEKDAANTTAKVRVIGEKIGTELRGIPWSNIASTVWGNIKTAFSRAGNFVDALLGDETRVEYDSMLRMNKLVKDTRGFGTKLGARISEAIAGIDWKEFGSDLSAGATKLFRAFTDMLNELTEPSKNPAKTGKSVLQDAMESFMSGVNWNELAESAKDAAVAAFTALGQTLGKALTSGIAAVLWGVNIDKPASEWKDSDYAQIEAMMGGAGSSFGGYTPNNSKKTAQGSIWDILGGRAYAEGESYSSFDASPITNMFVQPGGIHDAFEQGWLSINVMTTTWMQTIQQTVSQGVQQMVTLVLQPLNNLADVGIPGFMNRTSTNVATGLNTIQLTVAGTTGMQGIVTLVLQSLTNIETFITSKMASYNTLFSTGLTNINAITATAMTQFQSTVLTALTNLSGVGIPGNFSRFVETVTSGWTTINSNTATAMTQFQSVIMTALNNLKEVGVPNSMDSMASTFSSGFYDIASGAAEAMGQMYTSISDAVSSIERELPGRFRNMYNEIIGMANGMIGGVESVANSVVNGLNNALQIHLRFDRPDWAGGGSYWWDYSPNLPNVGFGRVSQLASGGILSGPTMLASNILAGEAGREAVLPLDSHTDWMDTLAERVITQASQSGINFSNGYDASDYDYAQSNDQELALLREQNRLLQQLVEKDYNLEVTTGQYEKAQRRSNRRAGKMVIAVGT